jgi:hypothetical protein
MLLDPTLAAPDKGLHCSILRAIGDGRRACPWLQQNTAAARPLPACRMPHAARHPALCASPLRQPSAPALSLATSRRWTIALCTADSNRLASSPITDARSRTSTPLAAPLSAHTALIVSTDPQHHISPDIEISP